MARHDLHTHLWPHRAGTPLPDFDTLARKCEVATATGVDALAVTEHATRFDSIAELARRHWRPEGGPEMVAEAERVWQVEQGGDLDRYVDAILDAKQRGLPLLLGIELDHLPGADEAIGRLLARYPFDVILGSVHWLGPWLFDAYDNPVFLAGWEQWSTEEAWERYGSAVSEMLRVCDVDVVAHLDVIKVAGHVPDDVGPHLERLVSAVVAADVAVEISSAGWSKPIGEPYPGPELLSMLVEAGVPFTSASDAHRDDRLGHRFDELSAMADSAGVTGWVTFDGRRRLAIPIN